MNVLITGITGNFGYALYKLLVNRKELDIFAGSRHPERVNFLLDKPEVQVRRFDFYEPETYRSTVDGADTVVLVSPPDLSQVRKHMFPFIDECRGSGVRHILFLSLLGAERNRFLAHNMLERYIISSGIDYTFLRSGFFMENLFTRHREEIRRLSRLVVPAGSGKTSFIAIQDVAAAGARCIDNPAHLNQAYELTGDASYSYDELAGMLSKELGRRITYNSAGCLDFYRHRRKIGDPAASIAVMALIYRSVKNGGADRSTADLHDVFGITPVDLPSFIRNNRDYFL